MSVFCGLPSPLQLLGAEFLLQDFQTQVQEGVGHLGLEKVHPGTAAAHVSHHRKQRRMKAGKRMEKLGG